MPTVIVNSCEMKITYHLPDNVFRSELPSPLILVWIRVFFAGLFDVHFGNDSCIENRIY